MLAEAACESGVGAEAGSAGTACKIVAVDSLGFAASLAVWRYQANSRAVEKWPFEEQLAESCWSSKALF